MWSRRRLASYPLKSKVTNLGVGKKSTSGKYKLACSSVLGESELKSPGGFCSREIRGATHPLLLSQSVQAKLGFTRFVRNGTVTMDGYMNRSLKMARQAKTGPFMIRIDHLFVEDYVGLAEQSAKLAIVTISDCDDDDDETEENPCTLR